MKLGRITKRSIEIEVWKDGKKVGSYFGYSNTARATGTKVQNIYKIIAQNYNTTLNGYEFKKAN